MFRKFMARLLTIPDIRRALLSCSRTTYVQNRNWVRPLIATIVFIHFSYAILVAQFGESDVLWLRALDVALLAPYLFLKDNEATPCGVFFVNSFVPVLCFAGPSFLVAAILIEGAQTIPSADVLLPRQYELLATLGLFLVFCSHRLAAFLIWVTIALALTALFYFLYNINVGFLVTNLPFVASFWVFLFAGITLAAGQEQARRQVQLISIRRVGASVAHELRTPLTNIRSRILALQKYAPQVFEGHFEIEPTNKNREELLRKTPERIVEEVDSALTLIDILLVKAQDYATNPRAAETFLIETPVKNAIQRFPYRSPEEKSFLIVESMPNSKVFGSPILLTHVILNLLKNALYYAASNKHSPEVRLSTSVRGSELEISIRDNGPGIPKNQKLEVFEPFYSGSPIEGTGVGLAFCKETVEDHFNGTIECESDGESYTRMIVTLPIAQDKESA
ncbi:MAG: HAMP domain-containing sensor histidine kinase [Pseudomonadota bacterium]